MWVPDEGRHTGTPSLPTYGVPSLTPAFDATIYNFPMSWMTTGQMTLRLPAPMMFFLPPFRKLRFQMIDNNSDPSVPSRTIWSNLCDPVRQFLCRSSRFSGDAHLGARCGWE